MRVLVTGSGGFCGQHLTRYLKEQGMDVHTLGYRDTKVPGHHYVTDVIDIKTLATVLKLVQPDFLFHLAGVAHATNPTLFYRINTQYAVGLLHALEIVGLNDCPVLLAGTAAEYGMVSHEQLPIQENLTPHPYSHYGISKLAQTLVGLAASRNGRPIVMVRTFNVIGPGMPGHLVVHNQAVQIVKILKEQIPPVIEVGNLKSSRDFIDVDEVVKVFWRLIKTPSAYGEIINVCCGKEITIEEILLKLIQLSGISIEVRPDPARFKSVDIPEHYGCVKKLQRFLGYVPNTNLDMLLMRILRDLKNRI